MASPRREHVESSWGSYGEARRDSLALCFASAVHEQWMDGICRRFIIDYHGMSSDFASPKMAPLQFFRVAWLSEVSPSPFLDTILLHNV